MPNIYHTFEETLFGGDYGIYHLTTHDREIAPLLEFYQQQQCLYPGNGHLPIAAITRILQISLPG